ncbi:MAG: SDR family oxidoreductase [Bacteroidales bacterium]|nr:SDR family oxidoreductase [Bacteroidales bacterium]
MNNKLSTKKLFSLEGRTALVTGSSGGLGKTLAEGLALNGTHVILNGRNRAKLEKTFTEFKGKGYAVSHAVFDVTNAEEIQSAVTSLTDETGVPDIIVNNAGINPRYPLEDFPEEEWDAVINTNLKSAFLVSKTFVKGMMVRQSGKIINICSLQSELGRDTIAPYAASKGGLKMLTRNMATEWARHNIQVNGIAPGYFKTAMTKPLFENHEFDAWLRNRTPAGRWGDPEELLGALFFLASDASSFVNGQLIFVDGGITAAI